MIQQMRRYEKNDNVHALKNTYISETRKKLNGLLYNLSVESFMIHSTSTTQMTRKKLRPYSLMLQTILTTVLFLCSVLVLFKQAGQSRSASETLSTKLTLIIFTCSNLSLTPASSSL